MDPNNRRATAKVNGQIITGTDVDQRVALIIAANDGAEISPQELQNLRLQVLRNLIDETLQIQEARAQEMQVTPDEVDQTYNRLAVQRFNRTPEELNAHLQTIGSSANSLKRQIEGELAWNRLVQRNVEPFVNVSSEEVTELHDRLKAARGTTEYRIGEIYLSATPATSEAVAQNARRIVDQIREGGSFPAYARQFSEASTAAVGGELGWIRLEQLQNPALEAAARDMQPGQLAGPIEIPGGFSILYVIDQRQIGMADPRDAVLSLKQISLDFPKGTSEAQARQRTTEFTNAVAAMRGCGDADAGAAAVGANVVNNDEIPVRALPEALQQALLQLNVGETTPPFGSLSEGVRVLMLCGRDDPKVDSGPNFDQLMTQLEEDRVGKRAQRYLRDLRRDAVIEYN
jgi:peptidyl-prolyl cis-trans isomerase SurA